MSTESKIYYSGTRAIVLPLISLSLTVCPPPPLFVTIIFLSMNVQRASLYIYTAMNRFYVCCTAGIVSIAVHHSHRCSPVHYAIGS